MAVGVLEVSVGVAGVGEELHEVFLGEDASWILSGVVGQQFVRKHVCTESECNASVWGREVVGVGGDAVLFAVVLMLRQDSGRNVTPGPLCCQIEQFLHELWIRGAVGVHFRSEPVSSGNRSISFTSQVSVGADARLIAENVAQWAE